MRLLAIGAFVGCLAATADAQEIGQLSAPDPAMRARAACLLEQRPRDAVAAIDELVTLLGDATTLAPVICTTDGYGPITVFADGTTTPGLHAARALAAIGPSGVTALIDAASDANPVVHRHVIRGLIYARDARAIPLFLAAMNDPAAAVRADAARGLGLLGRMRRIR